MPARYQLLKHGCINAGHVADESELRGSDLTAQGVAVLAAHAHRAPARAVDQGHQRFVHLAHQDHLHDLHRVRVGDP